MYIVSKFKYVKKFYLGEDILLNYFSISSALTHETNLNHNFLKTFQKNN